MVAQWFHESLIGSHSARGKRSMKDVRKRAVWRVYTSGMGERKMRSHAPR